MFREFLEEIKDFNYVVQRNWEELPQGDTDHPDLDIFVSLDDFNAVDLISKNYQFIDVRTEGDGYYPPKIEEMLLDGKTKCLKGYPIPNTFAHFMSLYYHNMVHKEDDPYKEKLEGLFKELYGVTKCIDEGVGYYV